MQICKTCIYLLETLLVSKFEYMNYYITHSNSLIYINVSIHILVAINASCIALFCVFFTIFVFAICTILTINTIFLICLKIDNYKIENNIHENNT